MSSYEDRTGKARNVQPSKATKRTKGGCKGERNDCESGDEGCESSDQRVDGRHDEEHGEGAEDGVQACSQRDEDLAHRRQLAHLRSPAPS